MVIGMSGHHGQRVMPFVDLDIRRELAPVLIQLLLTEEHGAKEKKNRRNLALQFVQVKFFIGN